MSRRPIPRCRRWPLLAALALQLCALRAGAQEQHTMDSYRVLMARLTEDGLRHCNAYALLKELTTVAPRRLSGSWDAELATELTAKMMRDRGFEPVRTETLMVPRWERGEVEEAILSWPSGRRSRPLSIRALGGSIATPPGGITGPVVEVRNFDELRAPAWLGGC